MPLFENSDEERTETATAYRREEFRKQGTVAFSREILTIVLLFSVGTALYFSVSGMRKEFELLAASLFKFQTVVDFGKQEILETALQAIKTLGSMLFPVFLVAVIAGLVASVAQVGFFITWEPLQPKWDRIDPISGFQKILSSQGAVEAAKALFKIGIGGWVTWIFFKKEALGIGNLLRRNVPEIGVLTMTTMGRLGMSILLALTVIAAIDYFWQRFRVEQSMRMTRREAKEEMKLRDGDPLTKSRIRGIQRKIAGRRMMENVPKADVIVTNPTHLAIALQYDAESMRAPKVTAKGAGVVAEKIKELAKFHRIPIVENKPLARTIYKEMDVGEYVPRELYKAVAEVLAYVYKLRGMGRMQTATA